MAADLPSTEALLKTIIEGVRGIGITQTAFWTHPSFWIESAGLIFAVLAFLEARKAKVAATQAGKSVKIQTVAIELTEISLKLDKLEPEIKFREARDLLSETSRRLLRSTSPFANEPQFKESIATLREVIDAAKGALDSVRPTIPTAEADAPQVVYFAIETHFSKINNCVANLIGLLEKQTIDFGD